MCHPRRNAAETVSVTGARTRRKCRSQNDECRMSSHSSFVIGPWSFIGHSGLLIRHSPFPQLVVPPRMLIRFHRRDTRAPAQREHVSARAVLQAEVAEVHAHALAAAD